MVLIKFNKNMRNILLLMLSVICLLQISCSSSPVPVEETGLNFNFYNGDDYIEDKKCAHVWRAKNDDATKVEIPSQVSYNGEVYPVTRIQNGAFSFCHNLKSVIIPNTVIEIENDAFEYCDNLKDVVLPNSIYRIDGCFRKCKSLKTIKIPNSVTIISDHAFEGCSSLENVEIPSSVRKIEAYAFYNCKLKKVRVPRECEIGHKAFKDACVLERY